MNLLKQSAHNLNQKIKDLEEVKQYLFYKKVIEEDAEIQKLLAKIKQTQDQTVSYTHLTLPTILRV